MKKNISLITIIVILFLTLSSCTAAGANTVSTDGSTSMEKVISSLGELFQEQNSELKFTYNPTGSSTGIATVADGRCDIGLSSRWLKDSEIQKGLEAKVLALDGIVVIVNRNNKINDLSLATIAKIYKGEIKNWHEIGGDDSEIVVIGREASSGTRDGFESITGTKDMCLYSQELTSAGDVMTAVANNPQAIAYTSAAAIKDTVKALKVDSVKADEKTIKDGSYKIQRPFILITKKDTELSATAQKFLDFCLSDKSREIIKKAGLVPVN